MAKTWQISGGWVLIPFGLVCIFATIFLMKQCSSPAPAVVVPNTDSAALAARIKEKINDSALTVIKDAERLHIDREESTTRKLASTELRLNEQFKLTAIYRKQLDQLGGIYLDTGITVHPDYVLYCDSLADVSIRLEDNYTAYKQESNTLHNALKEQLSLKDREIGIYLKGKQELETQNTWLTKGITEIANKTKPRTKFFGGFAIAGTQVNPVQAIGLGVAMLNKKEQLIDVNAMMLRGGELWIQVGGKFKFSFR